MKLDLAKAFKLGDGDPDELKKIGTFAAIVLLCTVTSWMILPGLLLLLYYPGYLTAFVRNLASNDNDGRAPEPLDPENVWHGLVGFGIAIPYSIPLCLVGLMALGGGAAAMASGARVENPMMQAGGLAGFFLMGGVASVVLLVVLALAPMIVLQYCKQFQYKDAFQVQQIFSGMAQSPLDYAAVFLVPVFITFGFSYVAAGYWFLQQVATLYAALVMAQLTGQYGAEILDMGKGS